jgi:hypothetical protein
MTRAAIIHGLTRALFAHIRPARRRAARVLFGAIEDQWLAVLAAAETQAYQRGVQDSAPTKSAEDAGFERGWRAGYQAAFGQVMARVGQPARCAEEDDQLPIC